jgi:hypothetical protein
VLHLPSGLPGRSYDPVRIHTGHPEPSTNSRGLTLQSKHGPPVARGACGSQNHLRSIERLCVAHSVAIQCSIRSIPLHWSQGTGLIHTVAAAGITASAGTRQGLCLTLVHQTLGCSSRWGCIHHKAGPTCGLSARWLFVQACLPQSWGSGELDLIQPSKLGDPRELNPGSLVVLLICFSR